MTNERQLSRIGKQLEKVVDKARVAQLAKSFGKGWNKEDLRRKSKDTRDTSRFQSFDSGSTTKKVHHKHHHKHHHYHHHHHHHQETDVEEEQRDTMASETVTGSATASPGSPAEAIDVDTLFREKRDRRRHMDQQQQASPRDRSTKSGHESRAASTKKGEAGGGEAEAPVEETDKDSENSDMPRFKRKKPPLETGGMKFKGGLMFIDRSQVEPMSNAPKEQEFYLSFDDTQLGLGLGKTQHMKIKFFKPTGTGKGYGAKILAELEEEKREAAAFKAQVQERGIAEEAAKHEEQEQKEAQEVAAKEEAEKVAVVEELAQISNLLKVNMTPEERIRYADKLAEFEKALMKLPNVGPRWKIEVTTSSKPPPNMPEGQVQKKIPRRNMFTRPSERVWYTPIPLTIKKYYRTNWKKIRFDVRKQMREWNYWPKMWINFEESHP